MHNKNITTKTSTATAAVSAATERHISNSVEQKNSKTRRPATIAIVATASAIAVTTQQEEEGNVYPHQAFAWCSRVL